MAMNNPYQSSYGDPSVFGDWVRQAQGMNATWRGFRQNPTALYGVYSNLSSQKSPNSSFYNWLGQNFNRYYGQYNAQAATNPTEQWSDYLKQINPTSDYAMQDPFTRGQRPMMLQPSGRMVW